jgi:hypothetical protein
VPAKNAYKGRAFPTWLAHAEQAGCPWFILSTKYGLLRPDEPVERYNVPVSAAIANAALRSLLERQGIALNLRQFNPIVLLDWERFEPLVRAAVPDRSVRCCVLRKLLY